MINERIVNALAKRWGKSGVSFEELKSEACKCAMEAIVAFDPDKGASIDTLQWKYIDRGLRNFVHKEWNWKNIQFDEELMDSTESPAQGISMFEITADMSNEARMVCAAIFSTPSEYISTLPKFARGKLLRQLRAEGWSRLTIWKTFNEIKSALN